jgi:hypothetical protein
MTRAKISPDLVTTRPYPLWIRGRGGKIRPVSAAVFLEIAVRTCGTGKSRPINITAGYQPGGLFSLGSKENQARSILAEGQERRAERA